MKDGDCKNCGHYDLLKMITSGEPFGYSGDIPCRRCARFRRQENDEFVPKNADKGISQFFTNREAEEVQP